MNVDEDLFPSNTNNDDNISIASTLSNCGDRLEKPRDIIDKLSVATKNFIEYIDKNPTKRDFKKFFVDEDSSYSKMLQKRESQINRLSKYFNIIANFLEKLIETKWPKGKSGNKIRENDIKYIIKGIKVYVNDIFSHPLTAYQKIASKLFVKSINNRRFDPFYYIHKDLTRSMSPSVLLRCPAESQKQILIPLMLQEMCQETRFARAFSIYVLPNSAPISDVILRIKSTAKGSNICNYEEFEKEFSTEKQSKATIGVFTIFQALDILKKKPEILDVTRFVVDGLEERTIEGDVLVAALADLINKTPNFPLRVLLISAARDPSIKMLFGDNIATLTAHLHPPFSVESANFTVPIDDY